MKLAPSILSADFSDLLTDVKRIEEGGADIIHVDVMDGHFVPNISFGAVVMKSLNGKTKLTYDVHLMIENPEKYIKDFVTDQTEYITVHTEVLNGSTEALEMIRNYGIKVGLSINPETDIKELMPYIDLCDLILVMSVHPGFGGQKFIPEVMEKVTFLDNYRKENGKNFEIEIDGGINMDNVKYVCDMGCDMVVAGSAVFGKPDIVEATKAFKNI
ncbi:MAG: ribulose-phosphate 3-epimerase [Clostridia bacterium]|nr:ribulose-phosphate 3-epimerase [Clostridia bacterium]